MSKAVLVMDMPESCDSCPLFGSYYSDMTCHANGRSINYPYPKDFRQDWCPMKQMPEESRKDVITIKHRIDLAIKEIHNLIGNDFDNLDNFTIKGQLLFISTILEGKFLNE